MLNAAGAKGKALLHLINMKMQEELERNNRFLGGRQALFMVAQAYVTADNTETYLGIEHLANLMMPNNDLETFWLRWEQIVSQLPPQAILPKGLETMLYNKIRKHPDIAQPIKDYERAATTSDIKNYSWLTAEVQRTVNMAKMHRNYQERDDRMKELVAGKNKVAVGQEDNKDKKIRNEKSDERDKKD